MNLRLRKSELLRRGRDIERVLFRGHRLQAGAVRVYYGPADEPGNRKAGFITAGRFSSAVARNRVRRLLREIYRTNRKRFPAGCDVLLRADRTAAEIGYGELKETLLGLAERIRLPEQKSRIRNPHGAQRDA
jgi:ribonuclease P protein component